MISHTANAVFSTIASPVLSHSLFPKFVSLPEGGYAIWDSYAQQTTSLASQEFSGKDYEVMYPASLPKTLAGDYLTFGVEYDTLILVNSPVGNRIFTKRIPAPILTLSQETGGVRLHWTSAYGVATRVYRTSVFTTIQPSNYSLIGEIDGVTSPAVQNSYKDIGVSIGAAPQKVSYIITNVYGSDEATLSFT